MLDYAIIYILLIIEHNGYVLAENGLGEVRVDKTIFINLLAPEFYILFK